MLIVPNLDEPVQVSYFVGVDGLWYVKIGDWCRRVVGGGAIGSSSKYVLTFKAMSDGTDTIVDLVNDSKKGALFSNTLTTNFSTDTAWNVAPYNANEVSGTGYTAGGLAIAGATFTESPSGSLMYDHNDLSWTTATFGPARGCLEYDVTLTNKALCMQNFGADYSVVAGTFLIQEPTLGIWADNLDGL